jgi:hypothetical protein
MKHAHRSFGAARTQTATIRPESHVQGSAAKASIGHTATGEPPDAEAVYPVAEKKKPQGGRLVIIDGIRGYLLLMMMLAHFWLQIYTPLFRLHVGKYSPVYDAEFFIPISGMVCALAYHSTYVRGGVIDTFISVIKRLRWLYVYQVVATLLIIALVKVTGPLAMPSSVEIASAPLLELLLAVPGLGIQPDYLVVLLIYINLMPFIPAAFKLLSSGSTRTYFGILIALWLASAFNVDDWGARQLRLDSLAISEYVYLVGVFKPMSYALLFFTGFYLGFVLKTKGYEEIVQRKIPLRWAWFWGAAAVNICFAVIELSIPRFHWPLWLYERGFGDFSASSAVSTAAISYCVYFLICKSSLPKPISLIQDFLRWLFTRPVLVVTGQNSLFVYAVHVVISWATICLVIDRNWSGQAIFANGALIASIALLPMLAYLKRRYIPMLP